MPRTTSPRRAAPARKPAAPALAAAPGADPGDLLDMDEAIARLKTTRPTFYRWLRSGQLKGMKVGRQWRFDRAEIERFLKGDQPRIGLPTGIDPLLTALLRKLDEFRGAELPADHPGLRQLADPAANPVARAVFLMIRLGQVLRASDLHMEPHRQDGNTAVHLRYRIDGVLHTLLTYDIRLLPAAIEQWKRFGAADLLEKGVPQDARMALDTDCGALDLRLCFVPTVLGESMTARFLATVIEKQFQLDQLEYAPHDLERMRKWLGAPWGLVIASGPTGCGKTTTLYSFLNHLRDPKLKIMSIEDPVEVMLPGVSQVQINPKTGLTFSRAIRAFLRTDPDVIMVGEIRDLEALQICQQAALTGHLVLTTLHTEDAATAVRRMLDIGCDGFLVADCTKLIIAQRLLRKLCPHCSAEGQPESSRLAIAAELARAGGLEWNALAKAWKRPVGCDQCAMTGYRGRMVVAETLETSPEIASAIRRGATAAELRTLAVGQGMTTMAADGLRRAAAGQTSLEEVLAVAPRR